MTRLLLIALSLLAASSSAQAFLWWGKSERLSPAQQTELARPYYERALEAENLGKTRRALKSYEKIYKDYPAAEFAAQSMFNYAVIQYERENWRKSFEIFQTILAYHASFPRFNQLIEYQFRIALALSDGDGVRFLFVIPYRAHNRAVGYFEAVIRNAPYSELAPLALMNIALIRQYKGETIEAIDALDRLINSYPNSLLAPDAYFTLAETFADLVQGPYYDQGATREAISYFEDFLILFSQSPQVGEAEHSLAEMKDVLARSKLTIGEYYFEYRRWYRSAEIFLNEAITIAPDSPAAARAREVIAEIERIREMYANEQTPADREQEDSFLRRLMRTITRS